MKKLADKLLATAITNEENKAADEKPEKPIKKSKKLKNLIFEDDENNTEDIDRFSTPPKKINAGNKDSRTPLGVANTNTPKSRAGLMTSTPKSKILSYLQDENSQLSSPSRIPVATARRIH